MKNLLQYIQENRTEKKVTIEGGWYGEMYIGTRAIYYDVPTATKEKRVFAFISYPKTPKPKNGYPAVLLIHGGNGAAFYEMSRLWADRGFITIAPDFNGKFAHSINERQNVNELGGNEGYGSVNDLNDQNTWAYFSVLSAMRAIDVLTSLEEVDSENVFSCGLSWGGFLQLLLSSVEKRIKAASIIYSSAFISNSEWGKKILSCLSEEEKLIWDQNIDPKNYLKNISCPVFFTAGADDHAFKMENRRITAEEIVSPVYFGLRKSFPHANFYGFEQEETACFFKKLINEEKIPQPKVIVDNDTIKINSFELNSELNLCYTEDDVENTERQQWESKPVLNGEILSLPVGCTAFFVTEKTLDGKEWSSKMIKIK